MASAQLKKWLPGHHSSHKKGLRGPRFNDGGCFLGPLGGGCPSSRGWRPRLMKTCQQPPAHGASRSWRPRASGPPSWWASGPLLGPRESHTGESLFYQTPVISEFCLIKIGSLLCTREGAGAGSRAAVSAARPSSEPALPARAPAPARARACVLSLARV